VSIDPGDLESIAAAASEAIAAGGAFSVEYRITHSERGERWLTSIGQVTRERHGWPARMSGITLDVTERRHADGAQARLAAIVESSDDAIVAKNLDGVIQSWNAGAQRLFGYTAEEAVGRPITILIPQERRAEELAIMARLRQGERIEQFETVRMAKDGRRLEVSLTVSPVRDSTGRVIGASKIARDVTEQKRALLALAEQREWLRVTLSSIGDAVIACDRNGRVTFLNGVAEQLTGWTAEEAANRPLAEVFHVLGEGTRIPLEDPAREVLRRGAVTGLARRTILVGRDGVERSVAETAAPILSDRQQILGVVLVFRDVGVQRRPDLEHAASTADRESLLESERAARSEAERASRLKDEFVATVSHELRTPLNAILGWTQILKKSDLQPAQLRHGLEIIERNTRVQTQLISDLLDVSRIITGKLRLEIQSIELGEIVRNAIQTVQPAADAKGIELRLEISQVEPIVADPERLQQVVWNLLSNAIKFTPQGGRVDVRIRTRDGHAEIKVADTGIGIRPEFLPILFERFRQADPSAARRFGGLGLGLAISKQLVELHGGTVTAESEGEGRGATFTINLPVGLARLPRTPGRPSPKPDAVVSGVVPSSVQGLRVLVVEDEPDTREMIQRFLEEQGAAVFTAIAADEALRQMVTVRPQILISDIGLPGMDGYELVQRVRALDVEQGGMIPAIALTAFVRSEDRTRALQAGYQAHLAKPVEPAELLAVINSFAGLITHRRGQPPAEAGA
jgi:PAS domain S-box-containing protein